MNPVKVEIDAATVEKFKSFILTYDRILIVSHLNPDGDAISSCLAMYHGLKSLGNTCTLYNQDHVPDNFKWLIGADLFKDTIDVDMIDAVIVLDCGDLNRVGKIKKYISDKPMINIDHHITNPNFGTVNIVNPYASCTGEVIFEIFQGMSIDITLDIATPLYCCVITDTGSFRYANSTPLAFEMASKLIEIGVQPWIVSEKIYENQDPRKIELLAEVLGTLKVNEKFASIIISQETMKKFNVDASGIDGLINYPRSIRGVEVAVQFRELEGNEVKISFRSKGSIDVSKLSQHYGGGGHRNAAGCTITGNLDEVQCKMTEFLQKSL